MEPFVQMPLGTYDTLKFNNEYLRNQAGILGNLLPSSSQVLIQVPQFMKS